MKRSWFFFLAFFSAASSLASIRCSRVRGSELQVSPRISDSSSTNESSTPYPLGFVTPLEHTHQLPHTHGRRGDLELVGTRGASLVVATLPDLPGFSPMRGAIVDVESTLPGAATGVTQDPLFSWRPALSTDSGEVRPLIADSVRPCTCNPRTGEADGSPTTPVQSDGIESSGVVDGVVWSSRVCATHLGRFRAIVSIAKLPTGTKLGELWNAGSATVSIDDPSLAWEGERLTTFLGLSQDGLALAFSGAPFIVRRTLVHITTSTFPGQISSVVEGTQFERHIAFKRASIFELLPEAIAPAQRQLTSTAPGPGVLLLFDAQDLEIGAISLPAVPLHLPKNLGSSAQITDPSGIPMTPRVRLGQGSTRLPDPVVAPRGVLTLESIDEFGVALPVHVIVRGIYGTATPANIRSDGPGAFASQNSVYTTNETTRLILPKGQYEVVVSAGPTHSIYRQEVRIEAASAFLLQAGLKRIVNTSQFTAADFHLHAAPSPDAPVSLEARVASLAAGGLELAVATDHNAITDYGPAVHALGLDTRLATIIGDEVTSQGAKKWGHFNAFPLAKSGGYYEAVPPYYNLAPEALLAGARSFGAQILQVNHARMEPQIGYLDAVHFHAADGKADSTFSENFDMLEVHNGLWLSRPDKVREGLRDAFGLLRLGKRTTLTGNSDSHKLFIEEAGYPRTYVEVPAYPRLGREARVMEGLKRGATTVSAGPLVEVRVDGLGPGGTVKRPRDGKVRVWLRVSAPAWVPVDAVDVIVNDETVLHFTDVVRSDGVRFERSVSIPIASDSGLVVWASAHAPIPHVLAQPSSASLGFTGFVYIDSDGDGKVQIPPAGSAAKSPQSTRRPSSPAPSR